MTLNELKKKLDNLGENPVIVTAVSGSYYDGIEHGYTYPELIVEKNSTTLKIMNRIKKHLHVDIFATSYNFIVATNADHDRAQEAQAIQEKYLNAFWTYIHNHGHSIEAQAAAIKAGQDAIKKGA